MTSIERLATFASDSGFLKTRGALNVGLVMSRRARDEGLPLDPEKQLAASEGQVRGLSGRAGDAILRDHGVTRSIGTEVGRTNRRSPQQMRTYVAFLNDLSLEPDFDLATVERFWVDQFIARFANQPFKLRREAGWSVQAIIRDLMAQALERQRASAGAMVVGTVLQHLVGAKLEAALEGRLKVEHHGANVSDAGNRGGDFDIGDAAIHVTSAPGELLIEKCRRNLDSGLRPIIVTTAKGVSGAESLAEPRGIEGKIEFYAVEQFVALNINELGGFVTRDILVSLRDIAARYNRIVDEHEHDPSLRIDWA